MTSRAGERKKSRQKKHRDFDDSPQAIQVRLEKFVERTRGWGRAAAGAPLPDGVSVLAGPTRNTQHR